MLQRYVSLDEREPSRLNRDLNHRIKGHIVKLEAFMPMDVGALTYCITDLQI